MLARAYDTWVYLSPSPGYDKKVSYSMYGTDGFLLCRGGGKGREGRGKCCLLFISIHMLEAGTAKSLFFHPGRRFAL